MHPDTLQRLLHNYLPDWNQSILQGRQDLGFSFDLGPQRNWEWVAAGKYAQAIDLAPEKVLELQLPRELAFYWVCCFFSDCVNMTGFNDLPQVKGPPFPEITCPQDTLGSSLKQSIAVGASAADAYSEPCQLVGWLQYGGA